MRPWTTSRRALEPVSARRATAILLAVAAVAVTALGLLRLRVDTGVTSLLPSGDPVARDLAGMERSFGGDPVVVLLESRQPRQLLDQQNLPKLLRLEGRLAGLDDVSVVYGPATVLNQIAISAQDFLAEIAGRRDGLAASAEQQARERGESPAEVRAAGRAAVARFDRRYGPLVVQGLPVGLPTLHNPAFVNAVVFDQAGLPKPQFRFVVPSPDAIALLVRPREGIDQQSTERLVRAVQAAVRQSGLPTRRTTVTGAPTVAAALGGRVRGEFPLLGGVAVLAVGACFLATRWLPRARRRLAPLGITLAATALVLAGFGWARVPMSLGLLAFLPILLGVGSDFPVYLSRPGRRRPIVAAALATTASFASLAFSPLPFVRQLGIALAVGVVVSVVLALLLGRFLDAQAVQEAGPSQPARVGRPARRRYRVVLLAGSCAVAAVGWALLPRLAVQSSPDSLAAGVPAVRAAQRATQVLGAAGEVDLVLHGPDVLTPSALAWSRQAENAAVLAHGDVLAPAVSPADLFGFLGPSPTRDQIDAATHLLPPYLMGAAVRDDRQESVITFGTRLQDLGQLARLISDIRRIVPRPPAGYTMTVTGLPVVAARGYQLVSQSRYLANVTALLAAAVVLLVALTERRDALRAVLAAAVAFGWGLLVLWITGTALTPLTVSLGSLTAAVGCEFTVLSAVSRRDGDRATARSVAVAAMTSAAGYAALAASSLSVLRQFGLVLAGSVALSYAAAVAVTQVVPDRRSAGGSGEAAAEAEVQATPVGMSS